MYHEFRDKFIEARKDPNMFITDLKCGEDTKHRPLRWSYNDMMNGYKTVEKSRYNFTDCILQKTIMKMDLVVLIDGQFTEITDNYFITIGLSSNFDTQDESKKVALERLTENYNELIHEKNYFKALKRLFSIQTIEGHESHKLITLFNSDLGRLYKCISGINTLILLLEQTFKPVPMKEIQSNLQLIKYSCTKITSFNIDISTEVDQLCRDLPKSVVKKGLEALSATLQKLLNNKSQKYLQKL